VFKIFRKLVRETIKWILKQLLFEDYIKKELRKTSNFGYFRQKMHWFF